MNKSLQVTHEEALSIARQHHQAGNLTLADATYRDILNVVPDDYTSLHYLGVISYQRGSYDEGVAFLAKAVEVQKDAAESWNMYGVLLSEVDKKQEAVDAFNKAIELKPEFPEAYSNLSNTLWLMGLFEEAKAACNTAIKIKPDYADVHINLGSAHYALKEIDEAIAIWEKALELNPNHPNAFVNLGNAYRDKGELAKAKEHCLKALELWPDSPEALVNLGNVYNDQGQYAEAESYYKQAIELRPNYIDAHNNMALIMMDTLRYEESIVESRYAIAFDPKNVKAHGNLAIALKEVGKHKDAEAAARKALVFDPDSAEARIDLADVLFSSDRLEEAETLLEEALKILPNSTSIYLKLSIVMERANKIDEALDMVAKALEISDEMPEVYHRKAQIHFIANQIQEALDALDKALEIKPDFPAAFSTKSEILQTHGDMEGAREAAEAGLKINENVPSLYYTLGKVKKFTEDDPLLEKMKDLAANERNIGKAQAGSLNFALFKAHEDLKQYDKSFEYLKRGNNYKRSIVSFDKAAQNAVYKMTIDNYTKEFIDSFEGKGCQDDTPIFIVGMPRSGTTLTEQIISSHPDVFGAGELYALTDVEKELGFVSHENCKEMGELYIQKTRSIDENSKTAKKITDKMPGNYMRLGQIVAAMPKAKIIHCRRNPVDTCLSCYKQHFARGHYWSYNWDDMVEHYEQYFKMMEHWRKVIPDRFIEIDYEDTVGDFENQARMLIDYVGMEWNDACLTPHKTKRSILTASKGQVRKPVYKTSVEAWRRYEDELNEYAEKLKSFNQREILGKASA